MAQSVPTVIRAEGVTEPVGDYVLTCIGGIPTAAGSPVPMVTFTFTFNAPVTSKVTNGLFNETLLIVDEPNSAVHPFRPVLNCGASGAPDNGPSGPGTCAIIAPGDPNETYDGLANGYGLVTGGSALCDGNGRPTANTYTCGRPNVFQGRYISGPPNVLSFTVPFNPPGTGDDGEIRLRTFRLTNVRVDSPPFSGGLVLTSVMGSVNINSNAVAIQVVNPTLQVGSVLPSISHITSGGADATRSDSVLTSPVLLREGFSSAWLPRNLSAYVGDHLGVLGNASFPNGNSWWGYNGAANNPADVAQNVPGAVYFTESSFTWQNNSPNGPPSPNPPIGFAADWNVSSAGGPLTSAGLGGTNTGISAAGVAQAGTRIAIRFTNIPPGGSVTLPTTVQIAAAGQTVPATGVLALTTTDAIGAGPYAPRNGTFTASDNLAVYEVLFATSFMQEDVNIPFTLAGFPEGTQLRGVVSYAPFYSTSAATQASASLPIPRFLGPAASLPYLSVFPNSGGTGGPVNALISVNPLLSDAAAAQILDGAQVKLMRTGLPDIPGIPTTISGRTASATFNLAGAVLGPRDLVVTSGGGIPTVLPNGFNITEAPPCSFTVGPNSLNLTSAGGNGTLVVSPVPVDCPWDAGTADSWITLGAKQGQLQPYTIAANPSTQKRSGSIHIEGYGYIDVSQSGACTYQATINPANKTVAAAGGTVSLSIAAPTGCPWTVIYAPPMQPTSPTSGSGNAEVTFSVDPNTLSTPRNMSLYFFPSSLPSTLIPQEFVITQSGTCNAGFDVSTQVLVTRGAILSNFGSTRYTQQVTIKNLSATPMVNVYLSFDNLTSQVASPALGTFSCGIPAYAVPNIAPGQSVVVNFQFAPGKSTGGLPPTYNTRVFTF